MEAQRVRVAVELKVLEGMTNMAMIKAFSLFLLLVSVCEGKKVKRVKAGKRYNDHDDVHLVVNKVG